MISVVVILIMIIFIMFLASLMMVACVGDDSGQGKVMVLLLITVFLGHV